MGGQEKMSNVGAIRTIEIEIGEKGIGGEYLTISNKNESEILIRISNSPTLTIGANFLIEQIKHVMKWE
jgi:hypothetical protein